jgi:ATP-binding cassette subfamily C exporter for protease/lipase/ATP-binding cassette subfamily C protein EexD
MKPFWDELWDEQRPYIRYLAGFSLLINLLYLAPAMFSLQVFDRVLSGNSPETLIMLLLGTGAALLLMLMLDILRSRLQSVVGAMLGDRLSPAVVSAAVARAARAPHHSGMESVRDVACLRSLFAGNGLNAVFDAPWAPIFVILIWTFHPVLGMGAALSGIVMLLLAWLNDRSTRRALECLQQDARRVSHYVESSLANAEVLQALGMTNMLLARWRSRQDRLAALQAGSQKSAMFFTSATRFARQAIQIFMMALGAWLVLTQQSSAGIMIATTILLGRALQPIEQLVASWRMLADARAAYLRLRTLSADFDRRPAGLQLPCPQGRLTVDAVAFRSPANQPVLMGVSFLLEAGQALAIIGPSGAGKSTLARLLTGVWAPATGTLRLDGADLSSWPREELGPWMGYLPQDVELFEGSVADNIARLAEPDSEAVVAAARRARVHELILSLPRGYETEVGEHGMLLSPGQRQRVALARALYGNPRLVVLDEPNANLDGAGEVALAQAIAQLRAEGVTSVIVTHRPSLIAHVDKILLLDAGRVMQFGPVADVMKTMQRQAQSVVDGRAA